MGRDSVSRQSRTRPTDTIVCDFGGAPLGAGLLRVASILGEGQSVANFDIRVSRRAVLCSTFTWSPG